MKIKIGEAQARMVTKIAKEGEWRVLLRANYKNTNKSNEVAFSPAEDMRNGDEIKVTIEKICAAPKAKAEVG